MRAKQGRCKRLYLDPPSGKWSSCGRPCCECCLEPTWLAWCVHQWYARTSVMLMLMLMLSFDDTSNPPDQSVIKRKGSYCTLLPLVLEDRSMKKISPKRRPSKIAQRKIWKLAEKSIDDRSAKNLPTDVRQRLPKEEFGSLRRSPSKIAPRKISQPKAVEDCPKKNLEVGEEVHRRSLIYMDHNI